MTYLLIIAASFLAGMLFTGLACFVALQVWIAWEEADELCNFED